MIVGKKSNKKSAIILLCILLLGITGCTFGNPAKRETSQSTMGKEEEYSNDSVVIIKDGIFQQGSEEWEAFKKKCQSQKADSEHPVSITIKEQYEYDELVWSMFSSSSSDNIEFDWLFWTHGDLTENEVSD